VNATWRRVLTLALFAYGAYDLAHPGAGSLIDGVDLAIHETGHLVFAPFGEFVGFAGGTIMQLLFPLIFTGYFWRRGDRHAASVGLWWVAQNCGNVATYAADARAQELPLVGGGEHDWFYMLSATGHLDSDLAVARIVRLVGWMLLLGATAWGLIAAGRSEVAEQLAT
jgi:hypothetical protein